MSENNEPVRLFVSPGCGPCEDIQRMVHEGRFNLSEVDLIDVSTEEGFPWVEKMNLTKLPTAFKGTKECKLYADGESLFIDCDGEFETPE